MPLGVRTVYDMFSFKKRNDDPNQWSTQQWKDHLLSQAHSEAEKQDIYAMFSRAE